MQMFTCLNTLRTVRLHIIIPNHALVSMLIGMADDLPLSGAGSVHVQGGHGAGDDA